MSSSKSTLWTLNSGAVPLGGKSIRRRRCYSEDNNSPWQPKSRCVFFIDRPGGCIGSGFVHVCRSGDGAQRHHAPEWRPSEVAFESDVLQRDAAGSHATARPTVYAYDRYDTMSFPSHLRHIVCFKFSANRFRSAVLGRPVSLRSPGRSAPVGSTWCNYLAGCVLESRLRHSDM